MKEETRNAILLYIALLIIISLILGIAYTLSKGESKPDASEFCVQNGYYQANMNGFDSGHCRNPNDNIFNTPENQYFGWDGNKWKFVGK